MTILIIGAGISGITAGLTLLLHGITNFVILESSDRIGGQNWGSENFIQNTDSESDFFNLLAEKKLIKEKNLFWQSSMALSNGDKIDDEIAKKLKIAIQEMEVGNELRKKFAEGKLNGDVLQVYEKFWCALNGFETFSDIPRNFQQKSMKQYELKNVDFDVLLGVLEELFGNLTGIKDKVQFNKRVSKVIYDSPGSEPVKVHCDDGSHFNGEYLISTLPLGVLKEIHSKTFIPPLPENKVNAIQSIGLGSTNKIFLQYENAWWDPNWNGTTFIWQKSELSRIKNSKYSWIKGVVGVFPVDGQEKLLQMIIYGKKSIEMEAAENVNDIRKGVKYLLKHFLNVDDMPLKIKVTKMNSDKNFRGSHSYETISSQLMKVSRKDLASPILNSKGMPMIFFAGEATSEHRNLIGAMESGKREALRLIDVLNGKIPLARETRETKPKLDGVFDVLILGAGAAGIGAARKLSNTDLSFLVLEGSESVGGRIQSKFMTNTNPNLKEKVLVSAGAQWLHGRRNPLFTYAKNKNLVVFDKSQEESGIFIRDDGIQINATFVDEIEAIVDDILEDADEIYHDENESTYPESLEKFLTDEFEKKIKLLPTEKKIQARQLLDWHKRSQSIDIATENFKDVSAKHWGRFEYIGGKWEHISLKNGFAEVLELMAKDVGSDKFVFNKIVEKVHWAAEMTDHDNEKVRVLVKCSDGSLYAANHVITTFSLGVLKHTAKDMFVPELPEKHQKAINCLGFGPITKIFLQFESNWWGEDEGIQFVYRENDHEDGEEENFLRHMSGMELVYSGPPNTMIAWVGNKGVELLEKLSDKEVIDAVIKHIEKFVGYSLSYPKRYFVSRWLGNPLTRGTYSYASIKCDADDITPKDLAAKITENDHHMEESDEADDESPLLQFAGEGASQLYYSTAHGAYLSGENAAKVIIQSKHA